MKKRMMILFGCVFVINLTLIFLPFMLKHAEENIRNSIMLLICSYGVYWACNFYILLLRKMERKAHAEVLCGVGTAFCLFSLCLFIIKLRNDIQLVFPMTCVIAMLATFANWSFSDHKKKE